MSKIQVTRFGGTAPKISAKLISDGMSVVAQNVNLNQGLLQPLRKVGIASGFNPVPSTTKTLYYYDGKGPSKGSGYLFAWDDAVDVAPSPVNNDTYDRIYSAGGPFPEIIAYASSMPVRHQLGIPAPTIAPNVVPTAKSESSWTRKWFAYYEEPDGRQLDRVELVEGVDVTGVDPTYTGPIPHLRIAASGSAIYILAATGLDDLGNEIGVVYPDVSAHVEESDLIVAGSKVTSVQTFPGLGVQAQIDFTYTAVDDSQYIAERSYVYTYVSAYGEEGPPSPPSVVVEIQPNQNALISGFNGTPPANRNIIAVRIYRTVTGSSGNAQFQFVKELQPFAPTPIFTYTDNIPDGSTGEALLTQEYDPPPDDAQGICMLPNGFACVFKGNTLYFSVQFQPHAYPNRYTKNLPFDIVGIKVFEGSVIVATKGNPYIVTGASPATMTPLKISANQPCLSRRSVVDCGINGIGYASSDGFSLVRGAAAILLTENYYDKLQWRALGAETMHATFYDNTLYIFRGAEVIIYDFDSKEATHTTANRSIQTAFAQLVQDTMLLLTTGSGTVRNWDNSTERDTYVWRSKEYLYNKETDFVVAQVIFGYGSASCTLRIYRNGVLAHTMTVESTTGSETFRLPVIPKGANWAFELEGDDDIHQFTMGSSMEEVIGENS